MMGLRVEKMAIKWLLLALVACHKDPPIPPRLGTVLELPSLAEAGATRRRANPSGFGELNTAKGPVRPRSCVEWELLHAQHAEPTNGVEEATDELARLRCDALEWLARARPSERSFVSWDESIVPLLPEAFAGKQARWGDDTLMLTESGTPLRVVLRPIAWGDLNGDGDEDLLLAVSTRDREGPTTTQRALALTRDSAQGPLRELAR